MPHRPLPPPVKVQALPVEQFETVPQPEASPLPAITFFISALLSLPCTSARLIFVVFIFFKIEWFKNWLPEAFSHTGFGRRAFAMHCK
jgi:hypothetical protein